jgi:hypothetical protein
MVKGIPKPYPSLENLIFVNPDPNLMNFLNDNIPFLDG